MNPEPYERCRILFKRLDEMVLSKNDRRIIEGAIVTTAGLAFRDVTDETLPRYLNLVDDWIAYKRREYGGLHGTKDIP